MTSIFGSWGADPFGELVEKATSELLPAGQEDIALNLEICDQVRAKQVPPKQAMQTLKRRISHKNPNVVLLALGLTDICIKNGGDHFLAEVASREFMDNLASILRNPAGVNFDVKTRALRLIQNWAQISEKKPLQMGYIIETYKALKSGGFEFPAADPNASVSAALVETMTAPEWIDGEVCMRCRTAFTTFNRKHHCRNCGNVFCQDCSGNNMALPWFGIGQEVRVCDGCFAKKAPGKPTIAVSKLSRSKSHVVPAGRGGAGSHQRSNTLGSSSSTRVGDRSARKKEEDDLALAIRLSLEASNGAAPSQPSYTVSQPTVREGRPTKQADGRMLEGTDADDDPDLAAAIAASLRDYAPPAPSAPDEEGRRTPTIADYARDGANPYATKLPLPPTLELPAADVDAILTFSQDAFTQELYARRHGRWQASGAQQQHLQEEYERATAARPRMAKSLDEATRRSGVLVSMHDKLSEAVRLYDRLLDAQLNRPTYGAYGQPHESHTQGHNGPVDTSDPRYAPRVPPQQSYQGEWDAYSTPAAASASALGPPNPQNDRFDLSQALHPQPVPAQLAHQGGWDMYSVASSAAAPSSPSVGLLPHESDRYSTGGPQYDQGAPPQHLYQGAWDSYNSQTTVSAPGAGVASSKLLQQNNRCGAGDARYDQSFPSQQPYQGWNTNNSQTATAAPPVTSPMAPPLSQQPVISPTVTNGQSTIDDSDSRLASLPSAPIGSPVSSSAKQSTTPSMSSAYEGMPTPPASAVNGLQQQPPWTRPVETPLIDL